MIFIQFVAADIVVVAGQAPEVATVGGAAVFSVLHVGLIVRDRTLHAPSAAAMKLLGLHLRSGEKPEYADSSGVTGPFIAHARLRCGIGFASVLLAMPGARWTRASLGDSWRKERLRGTGQWWTQWLRRLPVPHDRFQHQRGVLTLFDQETKHRAGSMGQLAALRAAN